MEAAAFILQNIDPDIDPCTDFYNFTCGKWAMKNVVPTGMYLIVLFPFNLNLGHVHTYFHASRNDQREAKLAAHKLSNLIDRVECN